MNDSLMMYPLDANDLLFHTDEENNIYAGGFSVQSAMMRSGMKPLITYNTEKEGTRTSIGGSKMSVSDIFKDVVIPSWLTSYGSTYVEDVDLYGGEWKGDVDTEIETNHVADDSNGQYLMGGTFHNIGVVDDDLFDILLDLAKHDPFKESDRKRKPHRQTKRKRAPKNKLTKRVR